MIHVENVLQKNEGNSMSFPRNFVYYILLCFWAFLCMGSSKTPRTYFSGKKTKHLNRHRICDNRQCLYLLHGIYLNAHLGGDRALRIVSTSSWARPNSAAPAWQLPLMYALHPTHKKVLQATVLSPGCPCGRSLLDRLALHCRPSLRSQGSKCTALSPRRTYHGWSILPRTWCL
jgi:hypothetical protein